MDNREHTDPKSLEALWNRSVVEPMPRAGGRWYRRLTRIVWHFLKVDLWKEPLEQFPDDSAVLRRIRIHEWATGGARRLRKLDREEAAEILVVTAMLLGFEDAKVAMRARRVRP
jgi:hypothetical protein